MVERIPVAEIAQVEIALDAKTTTPRVQPDPDGFSGGLSIYLLVALSQCFCVGDCIALRKSSCTELLSYGAQVSITNVTCEVA